MEGSSQRNARASVTFNEATRRLLDGTNFGTVATVNPDGGPQSSVVWVKRDGDTVLFSTTTGRQKGRNLARDPRVSLSIFALDDPYDYVEIRGVAELVPDPGKELPRELSHKYRNEDPPPESREVARLIVRVAPERITGFSA